MWGTQCRHLAGLGGRSLTDAKLSESGSLAAQVSLEKAVIFPGVSRHALLAYPRDAMTVLLLLGWYPTQ